MIVNVSDWIRCLRISASVGNPAVKFLKDGYFGVHSPYRGLRVFGKSVNLYQCFAIADINELIRNLSCIRQQEINVEVSEGKLVFAEEDKFYSCLTAPPEIVACNADVMPVDGWTDILLPLDKLQALNHVIKKNKAETVTFFSRNGWLVVQVGNRRSLWLVILKEAIGQVFFKVRSDTLSSVIGLLDCSQVLLSFSQTAIRFRMMDSLGNCFTWYLARLMEDVDEKGTPPGQERLLPPPTQEL